MEIWKTFKQSRNCKWEISSHGRIKKNGIEYVPFERGGRKGSRYLATACLEPFNGYIHRIVANLFIDNPENKTVINHINGNKHDNRVENLEWVTASENFKHAIDTGLIKPNTFCKPKSDETTSLKLIVYHLRNNNVTFTDIGNQLNISRQYARMLYTRYLNENNL